MKRLQLDLTLAAISFLFSVVSNVYLIVITRKNIGKNKEGIRFWIKEVEIRINVDKRRNYIGNDIYNCFFAFLC